MAAVVGTVLSSLSSLANQRSGVEPQPKNNLILNVGGIGPLS